jgi:hypothetical protein
MTQRHIVEIWTNVRPTLVRSALESDLVRTEQVARYLVTRILRPWIFRVKTWLFRFYSSCSLLISRTRLSNRKQRWLNFLLSWLTNFDRIFRSKNQLISIFYFVFVLFCFDSSVGFWNFQSLSGILVNPQSVFRAQIRVDKNYLSNFCPNGSKHNRRTTLYAQRLPNQRSQKGEAIGCSYPRGTPDLRPWLQADCIKGQTRMLTPPLRRNPKSSLQFK